MAMRKPTRTQWAGQVQMSAHRRPQLSEPATRLPTEQYSSSFTLRLWSEFYAIAAQSGKVVYSWPTRLLTEWIQCTAYSSVIIEITPS